jgi:hypothetical protein
MNAADSVSLHIPTFWLSRAFWTDVDSIPASVRYIRASEERVAKWRLRLQTAAPLRVGIIWSGNHDHANDLRRSVGAENFVVLDAIDGNRVVLGREFPEHRGLGHCAYLAGNESRFRRPRAREAALREGLRAQSTFADTYDA